VLWVRRPKIQEGAGLQAPKPPLSWVAAAVAEALSSPLRLSSLGPVVVRPVLKWQTSLAAVAGGVEGWDPCSASRQLRSEQWSLILSGMAAVEAGGTWDARVPPPGGDSAAVASSEVGVGVREVLPVASLGQAVPLLHPPPPPPQIPLLLHPRRPLLGLLLKQTQFHWQALPPWTAPLPRASPPRTPLGLPPLAGLLRLWCPQSQA